MFGGTFDPPHIGHVLTGQRVAEARNLDEILFVVANDPWQKSGSRSITPAAGRLRMVEQACYWSRPPDAALRVSDIEIQAGGPSYTANTLRALQSAAPNHHFEVIVGSDAGSQLDTWNDSDWLAENARFVMVQRGGQQAAPSSGFDVSVVECPLLEISSTDIRTRVAAGLSIRYMCPEPVRAYIEGHNLYRTADSCDEAPPS